MFHSLFASSRVFMFSLFRDRPTQLRNMLSWCVTVRGGVKKGVIENVTRVG